MITRHLLVTVTIAVFILGPEATLRAADEPRRGGEIKVATYGDPGTLDPHITTDVPAARIRNQICETLVTWDAQVKESPMLADSLGILGRRHDVDVPSAPGGQVSRRSDAPVVGREVHLRARAQSVPPQDGLQHDQGDPDAG